MIVTVKEIVEQDSFETQHGTLYGVKFVAEDEHGDAHWLGVNAKKEGAVRVGDRFGFLASGKTAGKWTLGKREQGTLVPGAGSPNPYREAGDKYGPKASHNGSTGAQAAKPVPTMSQAVAVLRECVAAVEGWGSDAHATTLFLGRLRGDIRRDPSQAEIEADKKRAEEAAAAAAAEAQRLADEAAARARAAAGPAGYEPSEIDDGRDIPF